MMMNHKPIIPSFSRCVETRARASFLSVRRGIVKSFIPRGREFAADVRCGKYFRQNSLKGLILSTYPNYERVSPVAQSQDLSTMKLTELRETAKKMGLKNVSVLRKADLISTIEGARRDALAAAGADMTGMTAPAASSSSSAATAGSAPVNSASTESASTESAKAGSASAGSAAAGSSAADSANTNPANAANLANATDSARAATFSSGADDDFRQSRHSNDFNGREESSVNRSDRSDRADYGNHGDRTERGERAEHTDRAARFDYFDRDRSEYSGNRSSSHRPGRRVNVRRARKGEETIPRVRVSRFGDEPQEPESDLLDTLGIKLPIPDEQDSRSDRSSHDLDTAPRRRRNRNDDRSQDDQGDGSDRLARLNADLDNLLAAIPDRSGAEGTVRNAGLSRDDETDFGRRPHESRSYSDHDLRLDRSSDRGDRNDRNARGGRDDRGDRNERNDHSDRSERTDRGDRTDRSDRYNRSDRMDRSSDRVDRMDRPDHDQPLNRRNRKNRNHEAEDQQPEFLVPVAGIVDILDSYAFVRTSGYLPGPSDVYVSMGQVKKYGLRKGDAVRGTIKPQREGDKPNKRQKFVPLQTIESVNGMGIEESLARPQFSKLTPLYPQERMRMETTQNKLTGRVMDLFSPIGKGQRGLIVSPPKAGKTITLQEIANAIATNNPEVHLMVVLVDERPEEVTDMQRTVKGEVISSTFDRPATDHTTVAELAIERAKRLVELGQDVVVLLDSMTRLARAYNIAQPASGRILSGGVDAQALYPPKKFFGAARNIENGGSLTIISSALVETGSKMDEVIFEEFKGTGNMELRLSRDLAEKRMFPAIDINASGTRREDLITPPAELAIIYRLRRALGGLEPEAAYQQIVTRLKQTKSNQDFLALMGRGSSAA